MFQMLLMQLGPTLYFSGLQTVLSGVAWQSFTNSADRQSDNSSYVDVVRVCPTTDHANYSLILGQGVSDLAELFVTAEYLYL